jgi:hypothetical protein
LAEQPDRRCHQSPLIRLGLEPAHEFHGEPHEGGGLLAQQFAEHRGRPHRLPIEDAHVSAVLVAAHQRAELAADELDQRRLARHRLHLVGMFELLLGQGPERRAQNLAIKPVLAFEMVIDGGLVDTGLGDDGADRGGVVAALGEQPFRRLHDSLAGNIGRPRHDCAIFQTLV